MAMKLASPAAPTQSRDCKGASGGVVRTRMIGTEPRAVKERTDGVG
jgi:hypothetical protein